MLPEFGLPSTRSDHGRCGAEQHDSERRQIEHCRRRLTLPCELGGRRHRGDLASVARAAELAAVGVDQHLPLPRPRQADPVTRARHRREVGDARNRLAAGVAPAQEARTPSAGRRRRRATGSRSARDRAPTATSIASATRLSSASRSRTPRCGAWSSRCHGSPPASFHSVHGASSAPMKTSGAPGIAHIHANIARRLANFCQSSPGILPSRLPLPCTTSSWLMRQHEPLAERVQQAERQLAVMPTTMHRVGAEVAERVVHPAQVPLVGEPEPAVLDRVRHLRPRRALLGDHHRRRHLGADRRVQLAKEGDRIQVLAAAVLVRHPRHPANASSRGTACWPPRRRADRRCGTPPTSTARWR